MGYYVTPQGVEAVMTAPQNLSVIKSALAQQRAKDVQTLRRRGWIAPDRRSPDRRQASASLLRAAAPAPTPKRAPRKYVRYTVTTLKPGKLGPVLQKVYRTVHLHRTDGIDTPALLKALADMRPNTVRWAIQVLRGTGLVKSVY
jgi:hypothetical protein